MAADTIRFIVTVAIVVYKGLIPVVGRMLTYKTYIIIYFPFIISKPFTKFATISVSYSVSKLKGHN